MTLSHPPCGRLPLLSARPALTFPAALLYCMVAEAHRCEQLAQGCYVALLRVGFEPATCWSQVQRPTRCATAPHRLVLSSVIFVSLAYFICVLCYNLAWRRWASARCALWDFLTMMMMMMMIVCAASDRVSRPLSVDSSSWRVRPLPPTRQTNSTVHLPAPH